MGIWDNCATLIEAKIERKECSRVQDTKVTEENADGGERMAAMVLKKRRHLVVTNVVNEQCVGSRCEA